MANVLVLVLCCIKINDTTDKVHTKFLIHKSDDELDKIMGYYELLEILEEHINVN